MEQLTDTLEWPLTCTVQVVRGKYFQKTLAGRDYKAVRFLDRRSGRYFYDLYHNDEIFLTRVNPLFLEFKDLY